MLDNQIFIFVVISLIQQVKLVTLDKFEHVCAELNEALKREHTAQQILNEQSQQLQELTMRLDFSDTEGAQKQQTLAEAMTVSCMLTLSEEEEGCARGESL